jgi:hypothetical protein
LKGAKNRGEGRPDPSDGLHSCKIGNHSCP